MRVLSQVPSISEAVLNEEPQKGHSFNNLPYHVLTEVVPGLRISRTSCLTADLFRMASSP